MSQLVNGVIVILTAIIGVAILSVIVGKNSQTAQVLQAGQQAFSGALGTAMSPVTGNSLGMGSISMPSIGGMS
jgi:PRD1 phage membrane DNA delivery